MHARAPYGTVWHRMVGESQNEEYEVHPMASSTSTVASQPLYVEPFVIFTHGLLSLSLKQQPPCFMYEEVLS